MTEDQVKKLRGYYHSLLEQQHVLEDLASQKHTIVDEPSVRLLREEIQQIAANFPNLLPAFNSNDYIFDRSNGETTYQLTGVRSYVGIAVGRLKTAIEDVKDSPVTQQREFSFVKDIVLRKVLERDYLEIQTAYVAKCWKSVIILSGGAIEAILTDVLLQKMPRRLNRRGLHQARPTLPGGTWLILSTSPWS